MALCIQNRPAEKCSRSELQMAELLAALVGDWVCRMRQMLTVIRTINASANDTVVKEIR